MIIEKILDFFFAIAERLLSILEPYQIDWNINTSAWQYVQDILNMIGYLLPVNTITAIIGLIVSITMFRIAVAVIRTIWGFIPFV